jgi:hypothetical protein
LSFPVVMARNPRIKILAFARDLPCRRDIGRDAGDESVLIGRVDEILQ